MEWYVDGMPYNHHQSHNDVRIRMERGRGGGGREGIVRIERKRDQWIERVHRNARIKFEFIQKQNKKRKMRQTLFTFTFFEVHKPIQNG